MLMLAPFATLLFLTVLWLALSLVGDMIFGPGSRVLAALRGDTPAVSRSIAVRVRLIRAPTTSRRPMRAQPQLRAAA
jgi:hypothetical protein